MVVTVNHRLNAFGYMYLGDLGGKEYADSGNAGMLDIVLALKWSAEYCGVWRGCFAGADLWAVGRRGEVCDVDGDAGGEGIVSSRADDERAAGDGEAR